MDIYLLRNLRIDRPNQVWAMDITYLPMKKGFLYLVAVRRMKMTAYFAFYNEERPHQSLANQTPNAVYQTASGGGAMILEKYGDSLLETSDPLRSSDVSSSIVKEIKATATTEVKTGQRRAGASEMEPTA